MTNNQLTEKRARLRKAAQDYQSTLSWYQENLDSPNAEQDCDEASTVFKRAIGYREMDIIADLLDEIDELQERSKPLHDKDLQGVIDALEHPAGINAAGKQVVRHALVELQKLRRSYLAIRGENEDLQAQLYEAKNLADAAAGELQERRKTAELPLIKVDRCDVCTEGARGGCGTCIFNGNFE